MKNGPQAKKISVPHGFKPSEGGRLDLTLGRTPFWERLKVHPGEKYEGFFQVGSLVHCHCHWGPTGYEPCWKQRDLPCRYCVSRDKGGRKLVWLSPTPLFIPKLKKTCLICLTAGAAAAGDLQERENLFGRKVMVRRLGSSIKGRMDALLLLGDEGKPPHLKRYTPDLVWRVLLKIWKIRMEEEGKDESDFSELNDLAEDWVN